MAIDTPFRRYRTRVAADWCDYNGHMNMAYYVMAFDTAVDHLFEALGIGEAYMNGEDRSLFAVEVLVGYERELHEGDPIVVETRILGADAKRLHVFHEMFHAEEGWRAARMEAMALHVDMTSRRTARFAEPVAARIAAAVAQHATLPVPDGVGRRIGMGR